MSDVKKEIASMIGDFLRNRKKPATIDIQTEDPNYARVGEIIDDNTLRCGRETYKYKVITDVVIAEGLYVYFILAKDGTALVVGQ